jgi:hypothetical protein
MFTKLFLAAVVLKALLVSADPNPTAPGPGDSYKEGASCPIAWDLDTTGKWTDMTITLKTGDNFNMVFLETVTTIDATKKGSYSFPCPTVDLHSDVYFFEFASSSSTQKYWTTRFTITDATGNSVPAPEKTQPDGSPIGWGTGNLIAAGDNSSLPDSSSGPSSLPSSSSSGLPGGSSSISSSSRLSSTRTPAPSQTGNSTNSQTGSNGDMTVAISKTLVFAVGLVASAAFFL